MKLFKLGSLAALLVPVGIALAALSFFVEATLVRITLQVLAIAALGVAACLGQSLVGHWQKLIDEAK